MGCFLLSQNLAEVKPPKLRTTNDKTPSMPELLKDSIPIIHLLPIENKTKQNRLEIEMNS